MVRKEYILPFRVIAVATGALVLLCLYLSSLYSYLLFHSTAEIFSIVIACGIFMVAWNTRNLLGNNYLLFIGIAYLFVAGLDLVHTLAYKGMGVFPGDDANLPTQLWIASRYVQSLTLLIAPIFLRRKMRIDVVIASYLSVVLLLSASIFVWDIFPDCLAPGTGLTPFKKISEYVISFILLASVAFLLRNEKEFDRRVLGLLVASILINVVAELAFTFYISVYGLSNLMGHFFKIISFFLIYKAIIETGLVKPYDLLFRNLKQSEEALHKAHDQLEIRVRERTAELAQANQSLKIEIVERNRAEEALRKSAKQFRMLVETMNDGLVSQNEEGVITYVNDRLLEMLGYSGEDLVGSSAAILFDQYNQSILENRTAVRLRGQRASFEIEMIRKDGRTIPTLIASTPIFDEEGHFKGAIGTITDITIRKQAEEANSRLAAIVESSDDSIIGTAPNGIIVSWNAGAERMYGFSAKETVGRSVTILFPATITAGERDMISKVIGGERVENYETVRVRKDGRQIHASVTLSPIRDASGRIVGISSITRDITRRKQDDEELRSYMAKLERSNEELKEFVFVASHDLHEPLRKVQTLGDRLKMKYSAQLGEQGCDYLDRMRSSASRMRSLIDALLDYSRVTARAAYFTTVDLNELVRSVVSDLDLHLEQTGGRVELQDLPTIEADADQMYRLFQNLINNSLKYHGEEKPLIKISCSRDFEEAPLTGFSGKEYCRIYVEDNGIGFDEKYLDRIFKPFQRLHARTEYEGTGIGLAICRKIAERHEGSISASSEPGKGATFMITLPVKGLVR